MFILPSLTTRLSHPRRKEHPLSPISCLRSPGCSSFLPSQAAVRSTQNHSERGNLGLDAAPICEQLGRGTGRTLLFRTGGELRTPLFLRPREQHLHSLSEDPPCPSLPNGAPDFHAPAKHFAPHAAVAVAIATFSARFCLRRLCHDHHHCAEYSVIP